MARMSVWERQLRDGEELPHPIANLFGEARKWQSRYFEIWSNVQHNLIEEGYRIGVIPGPKGGTTTRYARFYLYLPSASEMGRV